MARNFFGIFTENNPVMGYSKTFFISEAKGLKPFVCHRVLSDQTLQGLTLVEFDPSKPFVSHRVLRDQTIQALNII